MYFEPEHSILGLTTSPSLRLLEVMKEMHRSLLQWEQEQEKEGSNQHGLQVGSPNCDLDLDLDLDPDSDLDPGLKFDPGRDPSVDPDPKPKCETQP